MKKNTNIIKSRIKISRTGKVLHKKSHQSHYNSKDPGSKRRAKRGLSNFNRNTAKKLINLTR